MLQQRPKKSWKVRTSHLDETNDCSEEKDRKMFGDKYSTNMLIRNHYNNKGKYFGFMACFFFMAIAQLIVFNRTVMGKSNLED